MVIDRYSRKAIGWALDRSLTARVAVIALQKAIEQRKPPPGVVHHSDQGTQYASAEYAAVLQVNEMIPSMSRPANPYDNAACESFMKTLKQEEIYCNQYADFDELSQQCIRHWDTGRRKSLNGTPRQRRRNPMETAVRRS